MASALPLAWAMLPLSAWFVGTPMQLYGVFGGPDGGWDLRTWAVVGMYFGREWAMNLVVKRFDSLVKNLCNASATLVSYLFGVFVVKRVAGLYVCEDVLGGQTGVVRSEQA